MSQWTHVCGCIRIDTLPFVQRSPERILYSRFGNTVQFNDPPEKWELCTVPRGTEGSVQYKVVKTAPHYNHMAWGVIYIWGDLRDYESPQAIYEWIKKSCANLEADAMTIRDCIVKIDVEYRCNYLVTTKVDNETYGTEFILIDMDKCEINNA